MKKEIIGWVTEILHFRISPFATNCRMPPFTPNMNKFSQVHGKPILLSYASKQTRERFARCCPTFQLFMTLHKRQSFPVRFLGQRKASELQKGLLKSQRRYCVKGSNWLQENMFVAVARKKLRQQRVCFQSCSPWAGTWKSAHQSNDLW